MGREAGGSSPALAAKVWLFWALCTCSETDRTAAASDEAGKGEEENTQREDKRGREKKREDLVKKQRKEEVNVFSQEKCERYKQKRKKLFGFRHADTKH